MHQAIRWVILICGMSFFLGGCGSSDLSLLNDAKRFEPEWMGLSDKVTFIDRYLRVTERRYPLDLGEVEPYLNKSASNERTRMYSLKSQYDNMMEERDAIKKTFKDQKLDFTETVKAFNEWHNKLMRDDLDQEEARTQLNEFIRKHRELNTLIGETERQLIENIDQHNVLMRRITTSLNIFTNYDIRYDL